MLCYKMSSVGLLKSFVKKNTADIKKNTADIKASDGQQDVLKISIKEKFDAANGKPTFTNGFVYDQDGTYIRRGYAQIPIFDNSGQVIGSEVNDSVIQKQSTNNYMYRLNTTYNLANKGTINVLFHLNIKNTDGRFPVGITIKGDIISGSGIYLGKTGTVTVVVSGDKTRDIYFVIGNKKGYDGESNGNMLGDVSQPAYGLGSAHPDTSALPPAPVDVLDVGPIPKLGLVDTPPPEDFAGSPPPPPVKYSPPDDVLLTLPPALIYDAPFIRSSRKP